MYVVELHIHVPLLVTNPTKRAPGSQWLLSFSLLPPNPAIARAGERERTDQCPEPTSRTPAANETHRRAISTDSLIITDDSLPPTKRRILAAERGDDGKGKIAWQELDVLAITTHHQPYVVIEKKAVAQIHASEVEVKGEVVLLSLHLPQVEQHPVRNRPRHEMPLQILVVTVADRTLPSRCASRWRLAGRECSCFPLIE